MYPVSYCFVVAFNPSLSVKRITVIRIFNHTYEQLNDISYLTDEMIRFFDPITAKQLQDCAEAVHRKKERYSLIEMFSCKLKFVIDI